MRYQSNNIVVALNLAVLGAAVVSFLLIRLAIAQTAATSPSEAVGAVTEPTVGTSTVDTLVDATLLELREIHIIGTKYTDYFIDGTALVSFPGDPAIHANITKFDAPIPSHEGLVWDHSDGTYLYDTPSGDLEVGTFAQQPNGTYIAYVATTTIENATSTPFLPARTVVLQERPVGATQAPPAVSQQNSQQQVSAPATSDASTSTQLEAVPSNASAGAAAENAASTTAHETVSATPAQVQEIGEVLGTTTEEKQTPQSDASAATSSSETE